MELHEKDISELYDLLSVANENVKAAQSRKASIRDAILEKYGDSGGLGSVTKQDGAYKVKITRSKKVDWNQDALAQACNIIREWGEDPFNYVRPLFSVNETNYKQLDSKYQNLLRPARTVKGGSVSVEIKEVV